MSEYVGDKSAGFFGGECSKRESVLRVVHTEAKRTLSRVDFDMCLRIAEAAYAAGMTRAAEICRDRMHSELISAGVTAIHGCADAIRAEIIKGAE